MTTATVAAAFPQQDSRIREAQPMASSPVRVVGPGALKALMAYGGTVMDLRSSDHGLETLPDRVAVNVKAADELILLVASDLAASLQAAADLQRRGYTSVVVVNAEADPASAAPAETPG